VDILETIKKESIKRLRGMFFRIELKHVEMIEKIIRKTGETKLDLFKRLIREESKRIEERLSFSDTINSNLGQMLAQLYEISLAMKDIAEDSKATREGMNKVFSITIFLMKEVYRLTHFFANVFINASLLQGPKMNEIVSETNAEAVQSFNNFYETVMNTPSKGVVELLKKN
jgi:hypothetical protein